MPAIINFYGLSEDHVGNFSDQFMTILDLAPSFLEIAGTKHPGTTYNGRAVNAYQGASAMPYLRGQADNIHGDDYAFGWESVGRPAMRKGDWKIVALQKPLGTGEFELFNLKDDPGETTDLKSDYPEKFEDMRILWHKYAAENGVVAASDL